MAFDQVSYLTILIAGIAGYAIGSIWYMVLGEQWMAAIGKTRDELVGPEGKPPTEPFITSFICYLVIAFVLYGIIGHMGASDFSLSGGLTTSFLIWLGFVLSTMLVNHRFGQFSLNLTIIDSGQWLLVLLGQALVMNLLYGVI